LKTSVALLLTPFACLVSLAPAALAQQGAPVYPAADRPAIVSLGFLFGRTGDATGSSAYLEINPLRRLGFCAFAAQSRATSATDDGLVHEWDSSAGGCITTHFPQWQGFLVSPFAQFSHQRDHVDIAFPLSDGAMDAEMDSKTHQLWGLGVMVDRAIVKNGPRWAVRAGRNFGAGPAVQNAGGVYAVGGVIFPLDHPVLLGRSFKRVIGLKPKSNTPSSP
jgi:hypothetical protein